MLKRNMCLKKLLLSSNLLGKAKINHHIPHSLELLVAIISTGWMSKLIVYTLLWLSLLLAYPSYCLSLSLPPPSLSLHPPSLVPSPSLPPSLPLLLSPGDTSISAIAEALTLNRSLEMLLIAENPFSDEGGTNLSSVLCQSETSLRLMDIQGTRMSIDVERKVIIRDMIINIYSTVCACTSH